MKYPATTIFVLSLAALIWDFRKMLKVRREYLNALAEENKNK